MDKIIGWIKDGSKTIKFLVIVLSILIISSFFYVIVQKILNTKNKETIKVLMVLPTKNKDGISKSMLNGAKVFTNSLNINKYEKYIYSIDLIDENDNNLMETLKTKISQNKYKGIIGFTDENIINKYNKILSGFNIPIYTAAKHSNEEYKNIKYFNYDEIEKSKFIANYMRNIKKERIAYFAHDNSKECKFELKNFENVYNRFKIPLTGVVTTEQDVKKYFNKVDFGAVYVCGDNKNIVNIVNDIKNSGTDLTIYSNEIFSLNSTINKFTKSADIIHSVSVLTPLLFDTANKEGQQFFNNYKEIFNKNPDWLSAVTYDMTNIAFTSQTTKKISHEGVIREYDLNQSNLFLFPLKMGEFNGKQLISVPIQLQQISNDKSIDNYIQALRDDRVLYVNSKFMYKTNVVYTGVKINSVEDIKETEDTVKLDFSIWFRYQGNFDPSDIVFLNSDITLGKPVEQIDKENDHYVRFRSKGIFKLNYFNKNRSYGVNIVNIIYKHKKLNYNNLLFVNDILGMPSNQKMLHIIKDRKVIDFRSGWEIDEFFVSQKLIKDYTEGKPQFVGFQGESPVFSMINIELQIQSIMMHAKDVINKDYFIFLLILGFIGLISIKLMESKQLGRYWYVQSYLLRLIFLPMFIISGGNMLLNWAYITLNSTYASNIVLIYDTIWWIIPAYLINMAIKRFIWNKIEEKAGKKVPAIIIMITTFVIYTLAISGVIAFVFDEELTSILAASGVLAMVIGLAIKSNIANIFSGIVLNVDKPFQVGDRVLITGKQGAKGKIIDIGWRSTTIRTGDGLLVTIPNSKITNTSLKNLKHNAQCDFSHNMFFNPDLDPEKIIKIILKSLHSNNVDSIILKDDESFGVAVQYLGVKLQEQNWVSHFKFSATLENIDLSSKVISQVSQELYKNFESENLKMQSSNNNMEKK